jgi:hypothetical protein
VSWDIKTIMNCTGCDSIDQETQKAEPEWCLEENGPWREGCVFPRILAAAVQDMAPVYVPRLRAV